MKLILIIAVIMVIGMGGLAYAAPQVEEGNDSPSIRFELNLHFKPASGNQMPFQNIREWTMAFSGCGSLALDGGYKHLYYPEFVDPWTKCVPIRVIARDIGLKMTRATFFTLPDPASRIYLQRSPEEWDYVLN